MQSEERQKARWYSFSEKELDELRLQIGKKVRVRAETLWDYWNLSECFDSTPTQVSLEMILEEVTPDFIYGKKPGEQAVSTRIYYNNSQVFLGGVRKDRILEIELLGNDCKFQAVNL